MKTTPLDTIYLVLPLILAAGLILCGGCNPQLGEYKPRKRDYKPPVKFAQETEKPSAGSLWTPTRTGNYLFMDQRAMRLGDLVTVNVEEAADASREASTNSTRDSSMNNAITDFLALAKLLKPELMGAELLGGKAGSVFQGAGKTMRTERLTATVPATVTRVLPNGNLYIEGWRLILVNREEHRFYISGVIRPVDIADDNTVASSRIAEAEIEFNGRGVISDVQGPGVLTRIMNQYNPF